MKITPEESVDMDLLADEELMKLNRQYRIMEGDKAAYQADATTKLRQQKRLINILRNEQINVVKDLNIATSKTKKIGDKKAMNYIRQLLKEYECLVAAEQKEKDHVKELNYQIKKMEVEVVKIKARSITDAQCQKRITDGQKAINVSEHKLDVYEKRFNTTIATNFELRNEIDRLLIERSKFNAMWESLMRALNEGQQCLIDFIEQATLAYEQRDEWCCKLQVLKNKRNQDLVNHSQDMVQYQQKLDRSMKLHEFLGKKSTKRILIDLDAKQERKNRKAKEDLEQKFAENQAIIKQIQEFCNESDLDKVAQTYIKQEEENYAIFSYINELNHECEILSYTIDNLKHNIVKQRELDKERQLTQKETIEQLRVILEEKQEKVKDSKNYCIEQNANLDKLYGKINNIFLYLGCDDDPILNLLTGRDKVEGATVPINKYNVMMFLNILEKRVLQLVQIVYQKEEVAAAQARKDRVARSKKIQAPQIKKSHDIGPPKIIKPDSKTRYVHNSLQTFVPSHPCPLVRSDRDHYI